MKPAIIFIFLTVLLLNSKSIFAQPCDGMNIQLRSEIPSTCNEMTMEMLQDISGKPYLYVAQKEGGLKVYDISNFNSPVLKKTIPISLLNGLHVMNLSQNGNYLYLALGNHFNNSQSPAVAIIDISDPPNAAVSDLWQSSYSDGGCGVVKTEGDYAYIGAMLHGLIILDISDKHKIKFVSQMMPDLNYPTPKPDTSKYNARGMEVKNGIVYLCFDAGGVRIINSTDKKNPRETGRYSNPAMNGRPRAYNNLVVDDTLIYVTVDYCGLEVLNISDTAHIKAISWWNPWDCTSSPLAWFASSGHTNEIEYNKECKKLFLSTGKSDMYVVDISDPAKPDSCNIYGGIGNNIGTWGISTHQDRIYLSYICTAGIPFASNWTGVKILTYTPCSSDVWQKQIFSGDIKIYPTPSNKEISIDLQNNFNDPHSIDISIYYVLGNKLWSKFSTDKTTVDISHLPNGIYFLRLSGERKVFSMKFVKE